MEFDLQVSFFPHFAIWIHMNTAKPLCDYALWGRMILRGGDTHLLFHLQQPNVVWKKSPVLDGCSLAEKCMEKRKKRYTISHVWLKALLYFKRRAFLRMCINLAYHCTKSINNIKLMASHNGDIFSTICDSKSDVIKSTCLSYQWERRKLNISDVVCDPFSFWAFELHMMNPDNLVYILSMSFSKILIISF